MKTALYVFATCMMFTTAALADAPSSCIDKGSDEAVLKAYESNVESALVGGGYQPVSRAQINEIDTDFHDPKFEVTLNDGRQILVTCDDSGDDQCGCVIGEQP